MASPFGEWQGFGRRSPYPKESGDPMNGKPRSPRMETSNRLSANDLSRNRGSGNQIASPWGKAYQGNP